MNLVKLFKRKRKKKKIIDPAKAGPIPWDVPLDQTTAPPIVMDDSFFL